MNISMTGGKWIRAKLNRVAQAAIFILPLFFGANIQAAEIYSPKGVIELFTSQGCYNCPPADDFVTSIRRDKNVLALAWHVGVWDYLGWDDTFAKPDHLKRQRRYARSFGENQIYTPQAVINGRSHLVGHASQKIQDRLAKYHNQQKGMLVPIETTLNGNVLDIVIPYGDNSDKATLWMVYFADQEKVNVERGENHGKNLTYSNIVRDIELVGMMEPEGLNMMLPLSEISRKGYDSCALILQQTTKYGTPGAIIGAVVIRDLKG
jgi:hypothetical protein